MVRVGCLRRQGSLIHAVIVGQSSTHAYVVEQVSKTKVVLGWKRHLEGMQLPPTVPEVVLLNVLKGVAGSLFRKPTVVGPLPSTLGLTWLALRPTDLATLDGSSDRPPPSPRSCCISRKVAQVCRAFCEANSYSMPSPTQVHADQGVCRPCPQSSVRHAHTEQHGFPLMACMYRAELLCMFLSPTPLPPTFFCVCVGSPSQADPSAAMSLLCFANLPLPPPAPGQRPTNACFHAQLPTPPTFRVCVCVCRQCQAGRPLSGPVLPMLCQRAAAAPRPLVSSPQAAGVCLAPRG
jgi:hypothetical protein